VLKKRSRYFRFWPTLCQATLTFGFADGMLTLADSQSALVTITGDTF
jgi:hypothetical protein